jgi:hypothetical protein
MTLKEKFENVEIMFESQIGTLKYDELDRASNHCEKIADEFAIGFADWKDDNFLVYKDKTYYAKTSSQYFDITKYIGKEKPTKYYTTKELLEIYKKEQGL